MKLIFIAIYLSSFFILLYGVYGTLTVKDFNLKIKVTIQQILTAVHKFKQFSIKQHDQSIHCFNSMLSTGHQI